MRHSTLHSLFVFSLAVLFAAVANAQLSPEYDDWADGPAAFLLTKKEKKGLGQHNPAGAKDPWAKVVNRDGQRPVG